MKKLLIGCGVLLLLGLGGLGYVAFKVVPMARSFLDRYSEFDSELIRLDEEYPFDAASSGELDAERFATALDLRVELRANFKAWVEELGRLEAADDPDLGVFDRLEATIDSFGPLLVDIPILLEGARMGPSEFGYYSRLLWATLQSIEAGVAGPALEPLRGRYLVLKDYYEREHLRLDPEAPPLDQLVGTFDPALLVTAKQVLATDTRRVTEGIANADIEVVYMRLPLEAFGERGFDIHFEARGEGIPADGSETPEER